MLYDEVQTCNNLKLVDITDLWAMFEGLAAYSGVGEGSPHREVEVIRPRFGGQAMPEAVVQDVDPELAGRGVDVGGYPLMHLHFLGAAEGLHVDDDPLRRLGLPHEGVAMPLGCHRHGSRGAHLPHVADGGRDVGDLLRVEDRPGEEVVLVAEVGGSELVAVEAEVAADRDGEGGEGERGAEEEEEKHAV